MLTAAVVVAAALAVVFTRSDGGSGKSGEVFLQAADSSGKDPYTDSSATDSSAAPVSSRSAAADDTALPSNEVRGVDGGAPGLYAGTRNSGSCDVEKQIGYFRAAPSRNRAFAAQVGVPPSGVPAYLRSLTPVQLRADTRVTAHGYRDGGPTAYQSVLQTGTAVLVDGHGVPQVRCACGNPLSPPVAQQDTPRTTGAAWSGYRPSNVVVVAPAARVVDVFVLFDHRHDDWFGRHRGDHTGHEDRPAKPPADPDPMNPPVHHDCPSEPGRTGGPGATPCPSASPGSSRPSGTDTGSKSPAPASSAPGSSSSKPSDTPSSKPPASASASSKSPSAESPSAQSPGTGSPKTEPPGSRPPKTEPPKTQPPRSESPRTESPGPQSPKTEAPRSEAPKTEAPKSEAPKTEPAASPPAAPPSARVPSAATSGSRSAVSPAVPVSPPAPPGSAPPAPPHSGSPGSPPV